MKGVVLAGGTGSRLSPLTKITNKHLLPIYDKPMIFYPIETLVDAGIHDILIVTGGKNAGDFLRLLANGKQFGLRRINYAYQEGEGGIAEALALAEDFADGEEGIDDERQLGDAESGFNVWHDFPGSSAGTRAGVQEGRVISTEQWARAARAEAVVPRARRPP